ncbi:hypothetical protein HAX54_031970, partial [Datura stramonium]|nr:hypothetical protein [Datura stramonium]
MIELGIPSEIKSLLHQADNHMTEPSHKSEHWKLPKPEFMLESPLFQKDKLDHLIERLQNWVTDTL